MHVTRADNENYNGCGKAAHRSKIGLTHIKPLLANIISTRFKIHHALLRVLLQQHEVLNHHSIAGVLALVSSVTGLPTDLKRSYGRLCVYIIEFR